MTATRDWLEDQSRSLVCWPAGDPHKSSCSFQPINEYRAGANHWLVHIQIISSCCFDWLTSRREHHVDLLGELWLVNNVRGYTDIILFLLFWLASKPSRKHHVNMLGELWLVKNVLGYTQTILFLLFWLASKESRSEPRVDLINLISSMCEQWISWPWIFQPSDFSTSGKCSLFSNLKLI